MATAREVVGGFQKALGKGDFKAAKTYLDDHLQFVGPFESFDRPEPYLESLERLHHIIVRVEPKKTFYEGDDVCLLYDVVTNTPAGTAFIVEWHHVKGDKIQAIRVVFDPRPFAPLFKR